MEMQHDVSRLKRVEVAIEAMRRGEMVILVDDEDRENEGDLCMAAEFVTPQAINFMAKEARGLICLTLTAERCRELALPIMIEGDNTSQFHTNFTVSIDAAEGITTGISAPDRAHTIKLAVSPHCQPKDLGRPGHIFPLRAEPGGVLVRTGQTEGSVDLCKLAGLTPAGVIVEMMNEDGTMSRMPQLEIFSKEHNIPIVQVADLIHHRLQRERLVERMGERMVETRWGRFRGVAYRSRIDETEMTAFVLGRPDKEAACLVRVHAGRQWNDMFGGYSRGAKPDLDLAFEAIAKEGTGVLLYLARPVHVGLTEAFTGGEQPPSAENLRTVGLGAQVLLDLGIQRMRLLSRRPRPVAGLSGFDIEVEAIVDPRTLLDSQRKEK